MAIKIYKPLYHRISFEKNKNKYKNKLFADYALLGWFFFGTKKTEK